MRLRSDRATGSDGTLPNEPAALVQTLYHEVLTRLPTGLPRGTDEKIFTPYLSKRLLREIDSAYACARQWARQDRKRMLLSDGCKKP